MEIRLEEVKEAVKKCIQYYGEDEGEELLEKVWRIWTACKKAKIENEKEREKRKKEEAKIKKDEEKKVKSNFYSVICSSYLNLNQMEIIEIKINFINN